MIGILSAIAVVAYNGITQRASAAEYISSVDAWEKLLRAEMIETGTIPDVRDYQTAAGPNNCLGRSSDDFPADGMFPEGACLIASGTSSEGVFDREVQGSYNAAYMDAFTTKANFPSGRLRVAKVTINDESRNTHITYYSRGIVGIGLGQNSPTKGGWAQLLWLPSAGGMCGRGGGAIINDPANTKLTGELCAMDIFQ